MQSVLNEFKSDLNQLRQYIESNQKISRILTYNPISTDSPQLIEIINEAKRHLSSFRLRKVFEYNSLIITLYGNFEKYIETLIINYLSEINSIIPEYKDLPVIIKSNHFQLSAILLNNLIHRKYENVSTKEKIVENLHSCTSGKSFVLNKHAYIHHSSNLKHEVISEMMNKIGLNNLSARIKGNSNFASQFKERFGLDVSKLRDETLYYRLITLIEMRNDIAHGNNSLQIQHSTIISDFIDFIELYGETIHDVLNQELLKWQVKFKTKPFKKIITVINFQILCLEVDNLILHIGDSVIVEGGETANPTYNIYIIESIQINNENFNRVIITESTKIGIRLSGKIKQNHRFFLLQTEKSIQLSLDLTNPQ